MSEPESFALQESAVASKNRCPNSGSGSGCLVIRLEKEKEQE